MKPAKKDDVELDMVFGGPRKGAPKGAPAPDDADDDMPSADDDNDGDEGQDEGGDKVSPEFESAYDEWKSDPSPMTMWRMIKACYQADEG